MMPGQEAKDDKLEKSFRSSRYQWYFECTHQNRLSEAILMSTHNIQFHDEIRKKF